jgi:hypothetical protein
VRHPDGGTRRPGHRFALFRQRYGGVVSLGRRSAGEAAIGCLGVVFVSSAELSLDISHLVSRALNGEAIDPAGEGQKLAARYTDLGMTGDLIGKAIARAAGMVGVVLEGWDEEPAPIDPAGTAEVASPSSGGDDAIILPSHSASPSHDPVFPASSSLDDGLAAAIDADLAEFVSFREEDAILLDEPVSPEVPPEAAAALPTAPTHPFLSRGPVAAMRRALSRV